MEETRLFSRVFFQTKSLSILEILTLFSFFLIVLLLGCHEIRSLRDNFTSPQFEHREDVGKCWRSIDWDGTFTTLRGGQWIAMPIRTRNTADDTNFKAGFQVIALHDSLPSLESNGNHSEKLLRFERALKNTHIHY